MENAVKLLPRLDPGDHLPNFFIITKVDLPKIRKLHGVIARMVTFRPYQEVCRFLPFWRFSQKGS